MSCAFGVFFATTPQPTGLLSAIVRCRAVLKFCCYLSWLPPHAQLLCEIAVALAPEVVGRLTQLLPLAAAGVAMSLAQLGLDQVFPHVPAVAQGRPLAGE